MEVKSSPILVTNNPTSVQSEGICTGQIITRIIQKANNSSNFTWRNTGPYWAGRGDGGKVGRKSTCGCSTFAANVFSWRLLNLFASIFACSQKTQKSFRQPLDTMYMFNGFKHLLHLHCPLSRALYNISMNQVGTVLPLWSSSFTFLAYSVQVRSWPLTLTSQCIKTL